MFGVDNDGDGNCGRCAGLSDRQLLLAAQFRLAKYQEWINKAKRILENAWEEDAIYIKDANFLKGPNV